MSASITRTTWGPWEAVRLEDGAVSLVMVPAIGARVVSLVHRASGREWLAQGAPPDAREAEAWAAERVVFDGRTSFGWDECAPSVSVCADPRDPAGSPLRDHGDQWGRPAALSLDESAGTASVAFASDRWPYAFERRISLPGDATVVAAYRLVSRAAETLPVLWSMHPVFLLEPGTRIDAGAATAARLTWVNGLPIDPADAVAWPSPALAGRAPIDLSIVRRGEGWAAKLYTPGPQVVAATAPDGARLELRWDREIVPTLGIWLSAGGWPLGGPPNEQVALEPTTSPDDHLADAMAHDRALYLEPGGQRTWTVRIRLAGPA